MTFDRFDRPGVEAAHLGRGAERAIAHVPPGAARDLPELVRAQAAPLATVELDQAGQSDVADVHVEAHADRVGRDQVVDLTRLVQRHLGVARARLSAPSTTGRRRGGAPARRARTLPGR